MFLYLFLFLLPFIAFGIYSKNLKETLLFSLSTIFVIFFLTNKSIKDFVLDKILDPEIKFIFKYYAIAFLIFIFFFFYNKYIFIRKNFETKLSTIVTTALLIFCSFLMLLALKFLSSNFPIDQPATIYFVLSSQLSGGVTTETIKTATIQILIPMVVFFAISVFIKKKYKQIFYAELTASFKTKQFVKINFLFLLSILFFAISTLTFTKKAHVYEYPKIIRDAQKKAVDSDFYRTEYIEPKMENIIFPENKRNVIFIVLESIESSFADFENGGLMNENLIPHLTEMAKENINFSETEKVGGGLQTDGTSWTIAALVAKTAGIPYNLSATGNPLKLRSFLPKAITLNDILAKGGYTQEILFGSHKEFASHDIFFESHGNVKNLDIKYFRDIKKIPEDYDNEFWGMEDKYVYEFSKEELKNLSAAGKPFFFSLRTADTHFPNGYFCSLCKEEHSDLKFKDIIKCADNQIFEFIEWCKKQDFYDNTTIIIIGDHLFMSTKMNLFDMKTENNILIVDEKNEKRKTKSTQRRWLDIFINPAIIPNQEKNRIFSSYDIFPATLEAMGIQVKNHRLGFGSSLFSSEPTLLEKYSLEYVNEKTMEKTIQYENFSK